MAVAVTNCRRDSFRDIVPSMLCNWLFCFLFRVLHRRRGKGERASLLSFASREIRAELTAQKLHR
jgi:hypothetical protein